jgi:hypothetical protein
MQSFRDVNSPGKPVKCIVSTRSGGPGGYPGGQTHRCCRRLFAERETLQLRLHGALANVPTAEILHALLVGLLGLGYSRGGLGPAVFPPQKGRRWGLASVGMPHHGGCAVPSSAGFDPGGQLGLPVRKRLGSAPAAVRSGTLAGFARPKGVERNAG